MLDSISAQTTPRENTQKIIEENIYPDPRLTPEQQRAFIDRYSFSALVLQFVYYFAMGDALLAWASLVCSISIVLTPLLLIFPIWARRRAYQKRSWSSFAEFYHNQKKWDKEALYLAIASLVLLLISLWIIGPIILKSAQSLGGQTDSSDFTEQLQNTVEQYRSILGQ